MVDRDDTELYPLAGTEDLPKTPEDVARFMDSLTIDFTADPAPDVPPLTGEIMVVRSLRLPTSLELRAKAVAAARGVPTSEVLREWIADGAERAEAGQERDPATELHAIADAANRALRALEGHRHAA